MNRVAVAALAVGGGIAIVVANAEVFGGTVACNCTAHTGQVVCANLHVVSAGLPTTVGTTIDWTPPF
jgi:hypothetical protein